MRCHGQGGVAGAPVGSSRRNRAARRARRCDGAVQGDAGWWQEGAGRRSSTQAGGAGGRGGWTRPRGAGSSPASRTGRTTKKRGGEGIGKSARRELKQRWAETRPGPSRRPVGRGGRRARIGRRSRGPNGGLQAGVRRAGCGLEGRPGEGGHRGDLHREDGGPPPSKKYAPVRSRQRPTATWSGWKASAGGGRGSAGGGTWQGRWQRTMRRSVGTLAQRTHTVGTIGQRESAGKGDGRSRRDRDNWFGMRFLPDSCTTPRAGWAWLGFLLAAFPAPAGQPQVPTTASLLFASSWPWIRGHRDPGRPTTQRSGAPVATDNPLLWSTRSCTVGENRSRTRAP